MGLKYINNLKMSNQVSKDNNISDLVNLKSTKKSYLLILILVALNLGIFWSHYFTNAGIMSDFTQVYYPFTTFWTTAVQNGIIPEWNPFQSMGYPFPINPQTGINYPINWLFQIFQIDYTLKAAILLQDLHILAGSIGMFVFLNYLFKSTRLALVGAIAFQFFGGFFANAPHVDFVRSFVIYPWLFYLVTIIFDKSRSSRKILFIPPVILFLITGGYFGMFVSGMFMMVIFLILQFANGIFKKFNKIRLISILSFVFGLMVLGIIISTVHLGPFLQFSDEITRFQDPGILGKFGLELQHLPFFFMSNFVPEGIPYLSTSSYITLPILILASFVPFSALKRFWMFGVIAVIGVLMAFGVQSMFWNLVTSTNQIFELSRWIYSDYKIFIVIPIVIFAIAALESIIQGRISSRQYVIRTMFVIFWFVITIGIFLDFTHPSMVSPFGKGPVIAALNQIDNIIWSIIILSTTIGFLGLVTKINKIQNFSFDIKKHVKFSYLIILFFIIIILADGTKVVSGMMDVWWRDTSDLVFINNDLSLEKDGRLVTHNIFENFPNERPNRELIEDYWRIPGRGSIFGNYMMQDASHTVLNTRGWIEKNPLYQQYMLMKWTPILIDQPEIKQNIFEIPNLTLAILILESTTNDVKQTEYGINEIRYLVSLNEPKLLLENEIYFPGWTATLIFKDKEENIEALLINDAFRGWILPKGDYEMVAKFEFPNLLLYRYVSLVGVIIWVGLVTVFWKKRWV